MYIVVWWCNVLPDASFRQAVFWHWLPGLTCQVLRFKEKLLDINIPKQQFEEKKRKSSILTFEQWTHPSQNFSIFGRSKSQRNYGHIGFVCKLQLKRSTVNHVKDSNFLVCKRHSLCIGDVNIAKNLLSVRLWREFIVNWNLGCLWNCFQSPARVFTVCARCFSAFCACLELHYVRYYVTWLFLHYP